MPFKKSGTIGPNVAPNSRKNVPCGVDELELDEDDEDEEDDGSLVLVDALLLPLTPHGTARVSASAIRDTSPEPGHPFEVGVGGDADADADADAGVERVDDDVDEVGDDADAVAVVDDLDVELLVGLGRFINEAVDGDAAGAGADIVECADADDEAD